MFCTLRTLNSLHREHTILLRRERVNKGTKRMNSLCLFPHLISSILRDFTGKTTAYKSLVQSLNSPFFPPHIGTEPGRAKEESRITCMRMLRTPPFFSPQIGGKTIFESVFQIWLVAQFSEWYLQATISAFRLIKTMSINPKLAEFHQCHAKHLSTFFDFSYHNLKDNEINLCQDLLTIENTDSDLKVHALHYANELLVRVRLSFQKLL